jgi:S-adenosylmethionine decarboxylase proenzyme
MRATVIELDGGLAILGTRHYVHLRVTDSHILRDAAALDVAMREALANSGLHVVAQTAHSFANPSAVTGLYVLAESHAAVHTWPEWHLLTLDLFCCRPQFNSSILVTAILSRMRGEVLLHEQLPVNLEPIDQY